MSLTMADQLTITNAEEAIQLLGNNVVNVFEQMLLGHWVDDHGHDVRNNKAMNDLAITLGAVMQFRTNHLGYTNVADAGTD